MGKEMEQTNAERMQFLLSSLEMEFMNSQRELGPIDYDSAYSAIAELRQLIVMEVGE